MSEHPLERWHRNHDKAILSGLDPDEAVAYADKFEETMCAQIDTSTYLTQRMIRLVIGYTLGE